MVFRVGVDEEDLRLSGDETRAPPRLVSSLNMLILNSNGVVGAGLTMRPPIMSTTNTHVCATIRGVRTDPNVSGFEWQLLSHQSKTGKLQQPQNWGLKLIRVELNLLVMF